MLKILDSGHLFLAGGHHRYAIARVAGVEDLPFYVETTSREQVASMLPVRWDDA
jgi:ParB-like chromosome segregation protein Spo0J